MQVKDLDGNIYNWQLIGNISHGSITKKSSLHLKARELIHACFPTLQVLEEVPITVRRGETLYLDFYLPLNKRCVEVHGEQHYTFNRFYHHNLLGFVKHKKRDKEKKEWCDINNITLIELPFNESIEEWKHRLNSNDNQKC